MSGLLFTPENALKVLHDKKTQTRRIFAKGDYALSDGDLLRTAVGGGEIRRPSLYWIAGQHGGYHWVKFEKGKTKAVVPGRGKHAMWYPDREGSNWLPLSDSWWQTQLDYCGSWKLAEESAVEFGMRQLRVKILNLWVEPVQDICGPDCIAEGIDALDEHGDPRDEDELRRLYFILWDSINKKKGFRVEDDPGVTCVEFQREGAIS